MKSKRFEIVWERYIASALVGGFSEGWTEVERIKTNSRLKVFSARLANAGRIICPPLVPGVFVLWRLTIVDHGKK